MENATDIVRFTAAKLRASVVATKAAPTGRVRAKIAAELPTTPTSGMFPRIGGVRCGTDADDPARRALGMLNKGSTT